MSLNPDPKKQAQEVIFSPKSKAISHPPLVFNNNNLTQTTFQKHHGIILDARLPFEKHLETALCKINKTIGLIRKLQNILPRTALITFPTLIMAILFMIKLTVHRFIRRSLQHDACLALTGTIRGSSREKLYQELAFESLQQRRWYKKVSTRSLKTKVRVIYLI